MNATHEDRRTQASCAETDAWLAAHSGDCSGACGEEDFCSCFDTEDAPVMSATAASRLSRFVAAQDLASLRIDVVLCGTTLPELAARALHVPNTVTKAERRASQAKGAKLRCRTVRKAGTRANGAILAQRSRAASIATGEAVILPSQGFENHCQPTRTPERLTWLPNERPVPLPGSGRPVSRRAVMTEADWFASL